MATVKVEYEPSRAGWAAIALSPEILQACMAEARRGEQFAQAISPEETGAYKRSFHVVPTRVVFPRRGPRVAAILYNDDPAAAAIEFGNRHIRRPHRVLGKTAAFLGS